VNRALLLALCLGTLLSGCPLPQPLANYPKGTVTPPRILMDEMTYREPVVLVPAGCQNSPDYELGATLVDDNTSETVRVRWFVDYDRTNSARCAPVIPEDDIQGQAESAPDPTHRTVKNYDFVPYDHPSVLVPGTADNAPGVVHVVEMVVSNQFDSASDDTSLCNQDTPPTTLPYRTPASEGSAQFETQTYRWVFVNQAASSALPCP